MLYHRKNIKHSKCNKIWCSFQLLSRTNHPSITFELQDNFKSTNRCIVQKSIMRKYKIQHSNIPRPVIKIHKIWRLYWVFKIICNPLFQLITQYHPLIQVLKSIYQMYYLLLNYRTNQTIRQIQNHNLLVL